MLNKLLWSGRASCQFIAGLVVVALLVFAFNFMARVRREEAVGREVPLHQLTEAEAALYRFTNENAVRGPISWDGPHKPTPPESVHVPKQDSGTNDDFTVIEDAASESIKRVTFGSVVGDIETETNLTTNSMTFHTRLRLREPSDYSGNHKLELDVEKIDGVVGASVAPHMVIVLKSRMFSWEELKPKIEVAIGQFALDEMFRQINEASNRRESVNREKFNSRYVTNFMTNLPEGKSIELEIKRK